MVKPPQARELAVLRYAGPLGRDLERPPLLSHPTHVTLLPDGTVVVAECATSQLLHLTAKGELLGHIGQRGQGASEVGGASLYRLADEVDVGRLPEARVVLVRTFETALGECASVGHFACARVHLRYVAVLVPSRVGCVCGQP